MVHFTSAGNVYTHVYTCRPIAPPLSEFPRSAYVIVTMTWSADETDALSVRRRVTNYLDEQNRKQRALSALQSASHVADGAAISISLALSTFRSQNHAFHISDCQRMLSFHMHC